MEVIFNRRSIRKFQKRLIEKEKIDRILRAGMQAPSAGNQQPWEFIVVEESGALEELSKMSPYSGPVAFSGVTLVLLCNSDCLKFPGTWQQELGAAAENILLESAYLDLGAVWIGAETQGEFLRKMFHFPEQIKPFCLIAIGYPDGQKNEFIDRYKEKKVHYGKFFVDNVQK